MSDEWTWERYGPAPLRPPPVRRPDPPAVTSRRRLVLVDALDSRPRCPACHRPVRLTPRRLVMVHKADGRECPGTGRQVAARKVA